MSNLLSRLCGAAMVAVLATPVAGAAQSITTSAANLSRADNQQASAHPEAGQPTSFDDLPSVIQPMDTVVTTDVGGRTVEGQLRSLTRTTIELFDRDGIVQSFNRDNVQRIVLRDSLANGARNGSLIGAVPMLVASLVINMGCLNEGGTCTGLIIGLTGLGAGVGAAIGALVDGAVSQVVYERSAAPNTITLRRGPQISLQMAPIRASFALRYGW